jgi:hypothetical protein
MKKYYRTILYCAALVILVSGVLARKQMPMSLPTSALLSFCLAAKAGSRNPPILPAVIVGVLMTILALIANSVPLGTLSETSATAAVVGAVLLVFLRARRAQPPEHNQEPR